MGNNFIIDVEQNFNDAVFRSTKHDRTPKGSLLTRPNNSVNNGVFYNEPDDATYVFKTTKYELYTNIHGIIRPVRYNNILTNNLINGLAKKRKGVYIIKYFNFYKITDIQSILHHYSTSAIDIDGDILNALCNELSSFIVKPNQSVLKFRLIKFISEDDLQKEGVHFDNLLNGDLIIGDPSRLSQSTRHPITTTLIIEITDNNQDVYHMAIGNEVHSIYTGNNNSGKINGSIKLSNHGMTLIDCSLSETNLKQYGLFYSRKEALEFVNIDKRLEIEKMKHDKMKHDNELELTKLKRRIQLENFAADMYKRKLDLELTKIKFNFEKVKLYTTSSSTYIKLGTDIGAKIISMFVPLMK